MCGYVCGRGGGEIELIDIVKIATGTSEKHGGGFLLHLMADLIAFLHIRE